MAPPRKVDPAYLIIPLLEAFYWYDESLRNYLQQHGWPEVTRPQSIIMANIIQGVNRPSDIARRIGVSRQAVHEIINQMVEQKYLTLRADPEDGRAKIIVISKVGERRRKDAQAAMRVISEQLARRIGKHNVANLIAAFDEDWGAPISDFTPARKR